MDIFALGVLFHQYFTGELPGFNTEESTYSGEAAAKGDVLVVSGKLPNDIRELLAQMLDNDPSQRPSAMEVFYSLRGIEATDVPVSHDDSPNDDVSVRNDVIVPAPVVEESTTSNNPFFRPGDL